LLQEQEETEQLGRIATVELLVVMLAKGPCSLRSRSRRCADRPPKRGGGEGGARFKKWEAERSERHTIDRQTVQSRVAGPYKRSKTKEV